MDNQIDTSTGDYTGHTTDTLMNAAYLRLMTPLGGYWADRNLGSKLHLLEREKDVSRVYKLAKQYAELALQPLIDDNRAQAITVTAEPLRKGWLYLHITIETASQTLTFQHPVRVL
jgi:phage gp46-like protein